MFVGMVDRNLETPNKKLDIKLFTISAYVQKLRTVIERISREMIGMVCLVSCHETQENVAGIFKGCEENSIARAVDVG